MRVVGELRHNRFLGMYDSPSRGSALWPWLCYEISVKDGKYALTVLEQNYAKNFHHDVRNKIETGGEFQQPDPSADQNEIEDGVIYRSGVKNYFRQITKSNDPGFAELSEGDRFFVIAEGTIENGGNAYIIGDQIDCCELQAFREQNNEWNIEVVPLNFAFLPSPFSCEEDFEEEPRVGGREEAPDDAQPCECEEGAQSSFQIQDGFFLDAVKHAVYRPLEDHFLLLDEINRCNVPKVLGDLLTTLESSKRISYNEEEAAWDLTKGTVVSLPYSRRRFTIPTPT